MGYSIHRKILYFLIFLSFLISMRFWIGWEGRGNFINYGIGIISLFIILFSNIKFEFSKQNITFYILFIVANLFSSFELGYGVFFYFLHFFVVIFLNSNDRVNCLKFITKWFGFLMIPSLIVYFLLFITELPNFGVMYGNDNDWALNSGYGVCKNYIFLMRSEFGDYINRFNGPFLEPGHLGMISAFLLMVNHFDIKRKGMFWILLSSVFTLSLAAYVLIILGFIMIMYYKGLIRFKYILLFSLFFIFLYFFSIYYNSGDNVLYEKFFGRLQYDEDKGFSGNNRVFGLIDVYFAMLWNDLHTMLWGYPKEVMIWLADNGSRGTGYIMWLCQYGLIGTILTALLYLVYVFQSINKKYAIILFVFVSAMFWQRCYPFWSSWLICFLYGYSFELQKSNLNSRISHLCNF